MKNKTLYKILFVLILALIIVNGKYILSIAETFTVDDLVEGKIYDSDDNLNVTSTYGSSSFNESFTVFYLNKNEDIIATQFINGYDSDMENFTFFKSCESLGENYAGSCYDFLFDKEKIDAIRYWEFKKKYNQKDFCDLGLKDVKNEEEIFILDYICDDDSYSYNETREKILVFKEYIEPTFELECLPKNIKYNEKATCSLNVESTKELNEIKLTIATDLMKDLKLEVLGAWEIFTYNEETGELILKNPDGASGEYTAVNLNFIASENVDKEADVSFGKIEYKDQAGNLVSAENLNSGIIISKVENIKNPYTGAGSYIINLTILSMILLTLLGLIRENKKKML